MASWFSYIRSTIIGEELPSADAAGDDGIERAEDTVGALSQSAQKVDTLSCTSPGATEQAEDSFERQQTNSKPSLSQEQREHIKNVLRRAERSGRNANVVVDARHLKRAGAASFSSSANNGTKMDSSTAAVCTAPTACAQNEQQKEDDVPGQFVVQMDSLPEDVEVSVGPYSYCSYASSEMSYSEADKGYSSGTVTEEPPEGRAETAIEEAAASASTLHVEGEDGNKTIAQKMQKLSKTIDQWLKSLDREDSELALTTTTAAAAAAVKTGHKNGDEHTAAYDAPCTTASAVFATLEQPTILLDYLDTLSQSICVMATEHSANKLFERQFELVNQLSDAIANEVIESVLRLASSTIEESSKNAIDEAAHSLLNVFHSVEQNEKLEIDVPLKALHSVDLKPISMDQLETGDHNCYTILVEERGERRMTEEAINFVPKMPTTMTTMRNGGGGLSSTKSSFSSTFESGSTSGADSEPSSSDSVDVDAEKMPFAIVPTEKEQLLDIVPTKKEQLLDIVPTEKEQLLDIVPLEEQLLNIVPKVLNIVPKEEQLLDIVPKEKQLLDIVSKVLNIVPKVLDNVPKVLDIVPKKEQLLDIVPKVLDIVPKEEQLSLEDDEACSSSTSGADSHPETERDIHSPEDQLMERQHLLDTVTPKDEQKMDNMPTEEQPVHEHKTADACSCSTPSTSTSGADSFHNAEFGADSFEEFDSKVTNKTEKESNRTSPPATIDDQTLDGQIKGYDGNKNGEDTQIDEKIGVDLLEHFDWIKKIVEDNSKEEKSEKYGQTSQEEKVKDFLLNGQFQTARKMPKSFDSRASTITSGADMTSHASTPENEEGIIGMDKEQQHPKLTEEELAQIERVQRLAEEQQARKLTEEEWAQIERVQRLAEEQQAQKLTEEEWAQIERVQRLAEEQQAQKLTEEEWAQIERVQRLAEEQQAPNPTEEWAQIERVQRLAEEQQFPKPTEEWAQIERVQRLAEEQQAPNPTEEWAQIERVQRLAEEQQFPKPTEEWVQIERVQRLAEEQQLPNPIEEERAQIERVQRLAEEQQLPNPIEEERAQIEQVQRLAEEQQLPKLTEEELTQIERIRQLAEQCSFEMMVKSLPRQKQNVQFEEEESFIEKNSDEEMAQFDANDWCQHESLALKAANGGDNDEHEQSAEQLEHIARSRRQIDNATINQSSLSLSPSTSSADSINSSSGTEETNEGWPQDNGTRKASDSAISDQIDDQTTSCQQPELVESIERAENDECTMPESGTTRAPSVESIERAEKEECTMPESGPTSATSGADSRALSVESVERAEKDECTLPESGASSSDSRAPSVESVERAEKDECTMPESGTSGADLRAPSVESVERAEKDECTLPESGTTRAPSVESIERAEKDEGTIPESGTSGADSRAPSVESVERAEKDECTIPESGTSGADSRAQSLESIERAEKDECTLPESGASSSDSRAPAVESVERAEKDECTLPESGASSADSRAPSVESVERAEKDECTIPESGTSGADSRAPSVETVVRAEKDECTMPESGTSRAPSVESVERAEKGESTMPESGTTSATSGADSRAPSVESVERAEKDEGTMRELLVVAENKTDSLNDMQSKEIEQLPDNDQLQELSIDELAHIERIRQLAEQCSFEMMVKSLPRQKQNVQFEEDENTYNKRVYGEDKDRLEHRQEEWAQIEQVQRLAEEEQSPKLTEKELAQIERVQRLAEEQTAPKLTEKECAQIEQVQRLAEEQQAHKLTEEELAQIERVQRLAEEQQLSKLTEEELAQIERVQRLAEEQQAHKLTEEELAQFERVQRLAEEQQLSKLTEEELAQIERVQRLAEEQQAHKLSEEELAQIERVQRLAEKEWAQIEQVQRLAEEQQAHKLSEEELAQIERVQRLAEEQQLSKLTEEEFAQIERVQRLAEEQTAPKLTEKECAQIEQVQLLTEEQQLPKPTEEWTQIEQVQRLAEEQQPPKLTEEELAQIERVQRLAEEQQAPKLTEEEWAQIQQVQRLAEEQQAPKLAEEELAQIERVQRLAEEQQLSKLTEEEWAQIERVQLAEAWGSPGFENDRRTFDKKDALIDKTDHIEHDEGLSSASTSSADSNPSLPGSSTDEHLDHINEHINQLSGAVASVTIRQKMENGGVLAQQRTEEECSLLPADESSSSLSTSGADSVQSFERPQLYEPSTPLLLSDHDMEPAAVDVVHQQQQSTQKSPEMWPNAANFANNNLDENHRGPAESLPPMPTVQCLAESICGEEEGKQDFSSKSIDENAGRRHEMLLPANESMRGELQQLAQHKTTRQMSLTTAAMNSPSTRSRSSCSVMMMSNSDQQRRWLSFSRASSDIDDNNTSLLLIRPDDDAYAVAATGAVEEKRHKQYSTSSSTEKRHKQYSTSRSTEKRHKQYSTSSSTSSVNIVFTDHKLRRSFCVDHDEANAADVDIIVSSVVEDDGFQAVQSVPDTTEEEVADQRKTTEGREEDWANNIDFMIKLNFFAQRLSEEIADEAARDITNIIHIKQNPRALYFDDKYCELLKADGHQLHDQICSSPDTADDGWDGGAGGDFRTSELQDPLLYEVREMVANDEDGGAGRGGRLKQELISQLSVFTGLMRRRSAANSSSRPWSTTLTPFLAPRATTFSSSTATSAAKRKESIAGAGESGGGIMELLRRPSTGGTLEEGGADELPESALAGLSREEREHILKVVAESRRSPSAQASRSSSCSLHVRPEQVESKPQWTKPIEDATTQFSSTEIQQRISNDQQQQRPEEVQEVHSIGMKIFDGENQKEFYEVSKMEEFLEEPEEIQEVSKTEEFLENLSKAPEELNVECGAVSCGDYLPTKTEEKIEVESAKEAIMDDDVEQEEDEAVQLVNEFLHSENQNPSMAPLDVPTVMEDKPVDGMAMAMETYQQQMAKPAEAGWMRMFTRVEKKAKQIGTSMPSSIQSISAQMDLIKRNVDIQSLSDQFKRITDKKDILTEHSEKPMVMNNERAEVHALTDPSLPSFWARNAKGTTVEEQHLVIDHAKNAAVVDASRSSSSGFGDTIDDQQMGDDDGESFWHGQHRASVEQTARFVSSEINLFKEELERMDNELLPLFSETDQEQAILPPPAEATFEVPAQIVNETECGIVKGPVSRPTDSAAPPPFCTSICAKNVYGGGGLAPGADGGAPRAEEKEIEHFGWEGPGGTMEEEGDGRADEMMDDDKWTETKQKLEEKEEEEMAKREEKNFVWKHQRPGAEALEGNEHFGTTTTMEEKEEEEEEEEGREEAYEEQREESKRGGGRGRSIDWKCQEGENLSANGRDGRPPPLPPLLAPSEEAAAAAAVQPLAAEDILALLAQSFAPGATVGISTPASKSIWLEDGREIGGLESSKAYESAAGGACNSSSSSGGRGGAPFSVCLPPSSPAATSAAAAAAAAEANPFSLPQFPSPPAVKGENQKTKQKVAFTGAAQQQHSHSNDYQRDEAVHVHGEELGSEETRFVRSADEVVGVVPWAEGEPQNLPTTTELLQQQQQQLQDHSRVPTPFVAEDEQPQQHQSATIKTFPSPSPFTSTAQSTPLSIGKMFFSSTTSGAGGRGGQKQQQQQQTSSSFAGFGNKFGKLASDTLKGAKQAKEKAVTAMAQAGQTLETAMNFPAPPHQDGQPPQLLNAAQFVPQRPHSSLGLPIAGQSPEMPSKSSSLYDISLPPGFDLLSEEEQLRIISVMQCAELDAQLDATNANANAIPPRAAEAATKTDDKQRSTVVVGIAPADSLGIVPSADLDHLSQAEEAVHAAVHAAVDGQKHERHHDGTAGIEWADEVMEGEAEDAGHAKGGGGFMDTSHADGLDLAQYGQPMGMFRVETGDDHRRVDDVQQGQQYQTESGGGGEEDDEPWMQPPMHKFTAPLDQWEMPIRTATSRKQLWTTVFTDENDQQQQQQQPKAQPSSDEELGEELGEDELLEQISMDTVRGCWENSSGRADGSNATISGRTSTSSRSKMVDPEEQQMENELTKVARSIYTADFRADNQHYHVQNGKNGQEELKQSQQQQQQNTKMVDNRRIVAEHAHNNSYEIEMDDPWSPTLSPPKSTIMEAKKAMTTAMAHSVPPIITVTTTDDAGSGVEQEEDSEEDDDVETADERRRHSSSSSEEEEDGDYPDTVQSVPTVSPATIAELQEQQEMEQQQMVAQVFQQIQAFGEAADDEFDVQWAKPKQHHQQQHQLRKVVVNVEQQQQQQRDNFFMEDQANVYSPPEVETEAAAATKIGFIKYAGAIAAAADEQLLSSMSADQMTENAAVQQTIDANSHGGGVSVVDNDAEAAPRVTPIMYRQHQQQQQQQQLNRTNPFLNDEDGCSMRDDADEDEDDDSVHDGGIVVRQVLLDADDRSAEELERYYKSQLDQSIYFAPRPGPVYTIPETEEEEMASAPNREAIYHAERIERKPLHSGTVPPLISPEAIASTLRRKSGGSIGRSTAVVVVPPCTVTPTFDAIVAHAQPLPSSASRTTTASTSSTATTASTFPPAHLTPVRMAPPPPPPDAVMVNLPANDAQFDQQRQQQQQSMTPLTAMSAKPLSAAIHLQHQLQQLNQHKFDTNIAQQNDLPPPQWHNTSAAASINGTMPPEESGGVAAVVVPTDAAATASTRLKRSPAMILTGQCDLKSSSALATAIKIPNGHILGHGEERHDAVTTMAEFNHTHGRPSSQQHQQQNSLSKVRKSASSSTTTAAAAAAAATDPFQLLLCQHQIVPTTQQTAALVISNSSITTNAAAASSEMGRRRLPSLPTVVAGSSTATSSINFGGIKMPSYQPVAATAEQQQQRFFYSSLAENGGTNLSSSTAFSYHPSGSTAATSSTTTTIPNLITYYTSSAPEKCDAAVNGGDVSLLNSSNESRVLFDANVVAYAQSAALGPAPWSSSSTSSGTKPFVSSSSITETTMSTTTARTFGGGGGQQQQHIDWPRSVEDLPQKGPVVIPGALYHHGPSATTRMYLPPPAAAERVPFRSMSPPRRRVQQQQQYRSRTLERADQETQAMLNFKRELRKALEKRRKLLDLCDIEAGHREYVINKWLHSGILPSRHRSSDVDAIPPVIKCALPCELLANVGRIVPSVLPTQNVRRHGAAAAAATSQRKTTPTTTAAASSEAGPEKQQNTRTFGSQTGGSSPVHQAASRNTTANQLLHKCATGSVPRRPQNVSDASTQTALCAETQTDSVTKQFDGTSAELKWPSRLDHDLESHSRTATTTSAYRHPQHGNYQWLNAPEEDERVAGGDMRRQKRHRSRLGRFLHTDTEWERQLRERQTQQELNMRREQQQRVRHHEMMEQLHQPGQAAADNGTLADGGELLMTHYYPPPVEAVPASFAAYPQPQRGQQQHWTGSLPRLDHLYNRLPNDGGEEMPSMMMSGAEHLPSSYLPDVPSTSYQQQQQMPSRYGYSSLPRNYERSWGGQQQQQQRHFYGAGRPSPAFCPNFDYFGGNFSSPSLRQQPFHQQQHFGTALAAGGGGGRYSKSVQDLDQFGRLTAADNDRWWYSPSQMGSAAAAAVPLSRSVNCLDRLGRAGGGYLSDDANEQFHGNSNAMFHRRPATNGAMNMATSSDRLGLGGQRAADHNALLSNYANFLNNQFMLEQQHQRELDDRELMMASQQLELGQRQLDERMMEVVPPVMLEHPVVQLQHHAEECQKVLPPPLQTMPSASWPHPAAAASATALGRLPPCLYSRGEHNYGVRPPPDQYEDYGNLHWRNGMLRSQQQQPLYRQQDWINNNNNEAINYAYSAEQYHQPQALPMPTASSMVQYQQQLYMTPPPISALSSYQQQLPHISRFSWPSYQRQQQAQVGAVVWPNEQQHQQQQRHLSSAGDRQGQQQQQQQQQIRHPPHGILRRPRNSPPCSWTTAASNSNMQPSSDFYGRRDNSRTPRGCFVDTTNRPINNNNNSRNVVKASRIMAAENCFRNRSAETKRILLTRHYKHDNIFKDLGIRVVGGKKLSNGDLGAFITMLDTSKAHETLGELREGDQILEWNGVLLGGKTFEEVERVIQASNLGEIELIVRSRRNLYDNGGGELEDDEYRLNGADNECRGIFGGPGGENGGGEFGRQQRQTSTRKNIAFADSTKNGSNWHSPSEPPPIPAHRAQHNNHTNTNQQQNQSSTTTDEWCPEIKWPPSSALRRKGCGGGGGGGTMPSPHSNDDGYGDGVGVGVEHVGGGGGGGGHASAGHLQVAIAYDRQNWVLSIRLIAAHGLATCGQELPNPFIKVYLLPERKVSNKRRTKYVPASCNPIWDQLVEYSIPPNQLERHYLELTVLDYDRHTVDMDSRIIGQVLVGLGDPLSLNGTPKWLALQCAPPVSASMRNCSPLDTHFQLPTRTYYNPAVLDLLDGYPAIA